MSNITNCLTFYLTDHVISIFVLGKQNLFEIETSQSDEIYETAVFNVDTKFIYSHVIKLLKNLRLIVPF